MLAKSKLNAIEILISKAINDSYCSHKEFASICFNMLQYVNVLKGHVTKQKINNPKTSIT